MASRAADWEWVAQAGCTILTITSVAPPEPWIEQRVEAVAQFKYPAQCLTHSCPGHPNKGP